MRPEAIPTPVHSKGSKPYRIYADVFGDPQAHAHRPVTEAMSAVLVCAGPLVRSAELREMLARQHLPGVPVVAGDEELLGIVSWDDVAAGTDRCAGELMRHALALPAWTPIGKAAAIMASEQIQMAPIVDYERRVVGLLTALDIVRWLAIEDGYIVAPTERAPRR